MSKNVKFTGTNQGSSLSPVTFKYGSAPPPLTGMHFPLASSEWGHMLSKFKGPMTPYTLLNIANIRNIALLPSTPLNIF